MLNRFNLCQIKKLICLLYISTKSKLIFLLYYIYLFYLKTEKAKNIIYNLNSKTDISIRTLML